MELKLEYKNFYNWTLKDLEVDLKEMGVQDKDIPEFLNIIKNKFSNGKNIKLLYDFLYKNVTNFKYKDEILKKISSYKDTREESLRFMAKIKDADFMLSFLENEGSKLAIIDIYLQYICFRIYRLEEVVSVLKEKVEILDFVDFVNTTSTKKEIENYLIFKVLPFLIRKFFLIFGNKIVPNSNINSELRYFLELAKEYEKFNTIGEFQDINCDNMVNEFITKLATDITILVPIYSKFTTGESIDLISPNIAGNSKDFLLNIKEKILSGNNMDSNLNIAFNILNNKKNIPLLRKFSKNLNNEETKKLDRSEENKKLAKTMPLHVEEFSNKLLDKNLTLEEKNDLVENLRNTYENINNRNSTNVLGQLLVNNPLLEGSTILSPADFIMVSVMSYIDALKMEAHARKKADVKGNNITLNIHAPVKGVKVNDSIIPFN
jgi:hypothetical protein